MRCGLCGVRASAGQKLLVSSPGLCGVSLAKTSKGKPAQSVNQCQLLGVLDYSMDPAATCRVSTPCTNRPMKCSKCEVVIYSYSMRQHLADQHPTAMIPEDVESQITLSFHEPELVSQLLTAKGCKAVCKGASCPV